MWWKKHVVSRFHFLLTHAPVLVTLHVGYLYQHRSLYRSSLMSTTYLSARWKFPSNITKPKERTTLRRMCPTHKSMVVRIYVRLSSYYPSLRKSTNPIPEFTWFACHDWADHYTLLLLVLNNNCIYSFFRPVLVEHELSFILIYQGDTLRSLLPSLSQPYIIVVTKVVVYPSALTVDLTLSTKLA